MLLWLEREREPKNIFRMLQVGFGPWFLGSKHPGFYMSYVRILPVRGFQFVFWLPQKALVNKSEQVIPPTQENRLKCLRVICHTVSWHSLDIHQMINRSGLYTHIHTLTCVCICVCMLCWVLAVISTNKCWLRTK